MFASRITLVFESLSKILEMPTRMFRLRIEGNQDRWLEFNAMSCLSNFGSAVIILVSVLMISTFLLSRGNKDPSFLKTIKRTCKPWATNALAKFTPTTSAPPNRKSPIKLLFDTNKIGRALYRLTALFCCEKL